MDNGYALQMEMIKYSEVYLIYVYAVFVQVKIIFINV